MRRRSLLAPLALLALSLPPSPADAGAYVGTPDPSGDASAPGDIVGFIPVRQQSDDALVMQVKLRTDFPDDYLGDMRLTVGVDTTDDGRIDLDAVWGPDQDYNFRVFRHSDGAFACAAPVPTFAGPYETGEIEYFVRIPAGCHGSPPVLRVTTAVAVLPAPGDAVAASTDIVGLTGRIRPAADAGTNEDAGGLWLVAGDGGVFSFGAANFHGSTGGMRLNRPVVSMAATPERTGYWFVASDGGVFAFDAPFFGSMGGKPLNQPVVGMAATPSGKGYWLVASDGGIFAYGDAGFFGSMGGKPLNQPVVSMAASAYTGGYWMLAADGGIFAFNAPFNGSGATRGSPAVALAPATERDSYRIAYANGRSESFGRFFVRSFSQTLNAPIVGAATSS